MDERRNVLGASESVAEPGIDDRAVTVSGSVAIAERIQWTGTEGTRDHWHRYRGEQRRAAGAIADAATIRSVVSITERIAGSLAIWITFAIDLA